MKYIATIVIVIVMLLSSVAISQYDLTYNYDPGAVGHELDS
ncbi:hypothetical protein [Paenibacillus shenyangensis]|nr:hypothetical protein [Paenibacillus sp. A9]